MEEEKKQEQKEGVVFNIQRFSLHDGPGIRTTVFMKGCPLTCHWCSNPESQQTAPNLMVRNIQCKACGACEKVCPTGAIKMTGEGVRVIDWRLCDQCLLCAESCIYGSLNVCGVTMKLHDVVEEVMKDEAFYQNSEGGVTVSGGEPLLQLDFVADLLKAFKEKGLHTAVDTSGYVPWFHFEKVLPYVDLFLFDIKNLDPQEHLRTTGVSNQLILENLERLSSLARIWLRLPVITGFNDGEDYIKRVGLLAKKVGVKKVSLLPYHEGGITKCEQMGRPYALSGVEGPEDEHIDGLKEILEKEGLTVGIGN